MTIQSNTSLQPDHMNKGCELISFKSPGGAVVQEKPCVEHPNKELNLFGLRWKETGRQKEERCTNNKLLREGKAQ